MNKDQNIAPFGPIFNVVKFLFFLMYKAPYRISIEGADNIPKQGGFIIASNHASLLDPPAIGCIIPREVSFFAKKELCTKPIASQLIKISRSIPVDRNGFSVDSLKHILKHLKGGGGIVIFPEGTRTKTGKFLKPKLGVGIAAVMADVPVVPCWIEGSFKAKPFFSKITIHFLQPFNPSEIEVTTKKDHYLLVSERIMYDIENLCKMHMAMHKNKGQILEM